MARNYWIWSPTAGIGILSAVKQKGKSPEDAVRRFLEHELKNRPSKLQDLFERMTHRVIVKCGDPVDAPDATEITVYTSCSMVPQWNVLREDRGCRTAN